MKTMDPVKLNQLKELNCRMEVIKWSVESSAKEMTDTRSQVSWIK